MTGRDGMDPQITQFHADSSGNASPVKSANLRNLRIKTVRCFGCGPQAALGNLRMNRVRGGV